MAYVCIYACVYIQVALRWLMKLFLSRGATTHLLWREISEDYTSATDNSVWHHQLCACVWAWLLTCRTGHQGEMLFWRRDSKQSKFITVSECRNPTSCKLHLFYYCDFIISVSSTLSLPWKSFLTYSRKKQHPRSCSCNNFPNTWIMILKMR